MFPFVSLISTFCQSEVIESVVNGQYQKPRTGASSGTVICW